VFLRLGLRGDELTIFVDRSGLARISIASHQRLLAAQPVEEGEEAPAAPTEDEMALIIEVGSLLETSTRLD
jgi:hypothetical protein